MSTNPWYFFGSYVNEKAGHILYDGEGHRVHRTHWDWQNFDKTLCPPQTVLRLAALTRFYAHGYSALAFWDDLGDRRPGSNSIIFAPTLTSSPAEILVGARRHLAPFAKHFQDLDLGMANRIYQETLQKA